MRPLPQIGDVNIPGFVLPDTCGGSVSALESLYGDQNPDLANPLVFSSTEDLSEFAVGDEVVFDVTAFWDGSPRASNIRRA
jgi:hypothetical protein